MTNINFNIFLSIIAVISATSSSASEVDYSGHMVIRVTPETKKQIEFLRDWQSYSSMDFWSMPGNIKQPADIHVNPQSYYDVARTLKEKMMDHEIIIQDLGLLQLEEEQAILLRRANRDAFNAFDLENYHSFEEIMNYLTTLSSSYQQVVSTKVGGLTFEGRDIVQVTIGSNQNAGKKVIFFDCNIHAREWISSATCLWIIDKLVKGYSTDPEIDDLLDKYDWKFVPIANPDGYAYTWSYDRFWVKNRAVITEFSCIGVDANRNFPAGFEGGGSSALPCSDIYPGNVAFSENESRVLRDLIADDRGQVLSAISVHSYSQMWMSPYGYTIDLPSDYPEMIRVMRTGVEALTATYGTSYEIGNLAYIMNIASGVTTDHYYVDEGVIYAYTIELRDAGLYGYVLPPEYILPTAQETWNGIKAMINAI